MIKITAQADGTLVAAELFKNPDFGARVQITEAVTHLGFYAGWAKAIEGDGTGRKDRRALSLGGRCSTTPPPSPGVSGYRCPLSLRQGWRCSSELEVEVL